MPQQNQIHIQIACQDSIPISQDQLITWINTVLTADHKVYEMTLRLVDVPEIMALNKQYRKKDKATNVLAFPNEFPKDIVFDPPLLGDVVICPAVLAKEAAEQNIALQAHWAHIIIHGVLHLLGYDHIDEEDFKKMQAMEINLLATLGFANPYQQEDKERV